MLSLESPLSHTDLHSFPTRRSSDLAPFYWMAVAGSHNFSELNFDDPRPGPNARRWDAPEWARPRVIEIQFGEIVDRKSTRLNSSHGSISYAVFCLKKKNRRVTYS